MATRFWLCIKGGEGHEETFPIPEKGLVVGRSDECGLTLAATGLSGKHARFELESGGIRVIDLESRNGTKLDGISVSSHLLAHGDRLMLGKLELELVDRDLVGAMGVEQASESPLVLSHLDQSKLQRSRGLSPIVIVAILLGLGAGGFYAYREFTGGVSASQGIRSVEQSPGNLLTDGSFEIEASLGQWSQSEPALFVIAAAYRNRGALGLGAQLSRAEAAQIESPWCSVREGRAVLAKGQLRLSAGMTSQLSLELGSSVNQDQRLRILGIEISGSEGFEEFQLEEPVLPGFNRARLIIRAKGSASEQAQSQISIDDVSIRVAAIGQRAPQRFEEYELYLHGADSDSASLICIDDVVASALQCRTAQGRIGMQVEGTSTGWKLIPSAGNAAFEFEGLLSEALVERGMFTMQADEGVGGAQARTHIASQKGEFRAQAVSSFVGGEGGLLLRLGFSNPVAIVSKSVEGGLLIKATGLRGPITLQLNFQEQRNRAADLAAAARRAELPGESLALWSTLLTTVPFDAALVEEARAARSRQLNRGLNLLEEVRGEFERAKFFGLPDIYRGNAVRVKAIQRNYAGSEVAAAAERLSGEIENELADFRALEVVRSRQQMKRVAQALDAIGAGQLAEHVRQFAGAGAEASSTTTKAGL